MPPEYGSDMDPHTQPQLSVVIPTLGRSYLLQTVQSLADASSAGQLEVVVAGKIADVSLAQAIAQAGSAFAAFRILPVAFPAGDSSEKKNTGLAASRADIVAFLDDDVRVAPDWPRLILEPFRRSDVGMVSGPSLVPPELSGMARLSGMALASAAAGYVAERYDKGRGGLRPIKWSRIIGCNMAFRKSLLNQVGRFDPRFWPGEEMVAAFSVARAGAVIVFQPEAWVYHYPRATFRGFVRQIYGYGATRIRLYRAGLDFEPLTIVPALWVASLIVLGATASFCRWCAWLVALNAALYTLATLVITLRTFIRTRRALDFGLLVMIPVMHLTYGVAEWMEVIQPGRDLSETHKAGRQNREVSSQ